MLKFEQKTNIKFMCRLGKSISETLIASQTVNGVDSLKKTAIYEWFSRFRGGHESLEDESRSGRQATETRKNGLASETVNQIRPKNDHR
ncbi:hypothetical protein AVEN_114251-1 [Araneus ventricosus]|uniref:Mos1 transposase HTH domain-containing protein n=1 Tax=Araneus ventricosus TaxID=182803 RepID=A0A4Y2MDI4_ARAVE|nr:hypothetical protein AVEN_114251-1 [Araneus ventricosus]